MSYRQHNAEQDCEDNSQSWVSDMVHGVVDNAQVPLMENETVPEMDPAYGLQNLTASFEPQQINYPQSMYGYPPGTGGYHWMAPAHAYPIQVGAAEWYQTGSFINRAANANALLDPQLPLASSPAMYLPSTPEHPALSYATVSPGQIMTTGNAQSSQFHSSPPAWSPYPPRRQSTPRDTSFAGHAAFGCAKSPEPRSSPPVMTNPSTTPRVKVEADENADKDKSSPIDGENLYVVGHKEPHVSSSQECQPLGPTIASNAEANAHRLQTGMPLLSGQSQELPPSSSQKAFSTGPGAILNAGNNNIAKFHPGSNGHIPAPLASLPAYKAHGQHAHQDAPKSQIGKPVSKPSKMVVLKTRTIPTRAATAGSEVSPGTGDVQDIGEEMLLDGHEQEPFHKYGSSGMILDYIRDQSYISSAMEHKLNWPNLTAALIARQNPPSPSYVPPPDPSKPTTNDDECCYVALMLDAVFDMSEAEDNLTFRKTWSDGLERNRKRIESGVWHVLEMLMTYHSRPGFIGGRPRRKAAVIDTSNKYTCFAAHVEKICELFRRHKTACRNLIQEGALQILVDDPDKYEERTRTNQKVNSTRKTIAEENRVLAHATRAASEVQEPEALSQLFELAASPHTVHKKRVLRKKPGADTEETEDAQSGSKRKRGPKAAVRGDMIEAKPLKRKRGKMATDPADSMPSDTGTSAGEEADSPKKASSTPGKRPRGRPRKNAEDDEA